MTRPVVPPAITDTVAPMGPNGRAMLEERHEVCGVTHGGISCAMGICPYAPKQPSPRPTVESEHETLVIKIVAVGAFPQMAKRIAAMLIREYKMVPNETEVPDER